MRHHFLLKKKIHFWDLPAESAIQVHSINREDSLGFLIFINNNALQCV